MQLRGRIAAVQVLEATSNAAANHEIGGTNHETTIDIP